METSSLIPLVLHFGGLVSSMSTVCLLLSPPWIHCLSGSIITAFNLSPCNTKNLLSRASSCIQHCRSYCDTLYPKSSSCCRHGDVSMDRYRTHRLLVYSITVITWTLSIQMPVLALVSMDASFPRIQRHCYYPDTKHSNARTCSGLQGCIVSMDTASLLLP